MDRYLHIEYHRKFDSDFSISTLVIWFPFADLSLGFISHLDFSTTWRYFPRSS